MQKYIPLIILVLLVLGLALYFGPGLYKGYTFRRDSRLMLDAAKMGNLTGVTGAIDKLQQPRIRPLINHYVPMDYYQHIKSLKLTSWDLRDDGSIWSIVTLQIDQGGEMGIYQGKLHWLFDGRRWWWDFEGSYGGVFAPSGEPAWTRLGDLIPLAEAL